MEQRRRPSGTIGGQARLVGVPLLARLVKLFEINDWDQVASRQVLQERHPLQHRVSHGLLGDVLVKVVEGAAAKLVHIWNAADFGRSDRAESGQNEALRKWVGNISRADFDDRGCALEVEGFRAGPEQAIPLLLLWVNLLRVDERSSVKVKSAAFDANEKWQNHVFMEMTFGEGKSEGALPTVPILAVSLLLNESLLLSLQV